MQAGCLVTVFSVRPAWTDCLAVQALVSQAPGLALALSIAQGENHEQPADMPSDERQRRRPDCRQLNQVIACQRPKERTHVN
jgi:hypothetical protein